MSSEIAVHEPDEERRGSNECDADWVMAGLPDEASGGVMLVASKKLTRAAFQRRIAGFEKGWRGARLPVWEATLAAQMRDLTFIRAATYPEALASLMELWRPPERPAQRPSPAALEGSADVQA